jgi:hypothetical protein
MTRAPFSHRIDTWVSEPFAQTIESIADARAMTNSAVVREAIAVYLNSIGMTPQRTARPNGAHQGAE